MSDLVRSPENRFPHSTAHIFNCKLLNDTHQCENENARFSHGSCSYINTHVPGKIQVDFKLHVEVC